MTRTFLQILLLLVATNGAPVLAAYFMGRRGDLPVDFGKRLGDGRALFGSSKTWRGLLAATLTPAGITARREIRSKLAGVIGARPMVSK